MKHRILLASMLLAIGTSCAFAQTTAAETVQRDVNQQTRIENGLKNGSLNTREAGRLEREQSQIERLQAKDLKDGKLTPRERAQLERAQNRASHDIHAAKSNVN
jgi:cell division protein FtsB